MSFITDGFVWSGHSGRGRFASFLAVSFALLLLSQWLILDFSGTRRVLGLLIYAALLVPSVGYVVRRLHDIGRRGLWALFLVVPLLNLVLVLVLLFVPPQQQKWETGTSLLTRLGFGACLLIALVTLSRILWAPVWIPSGSMKPTLLVGDYLSVSLTGSQPERGDVIVYRHPVGNKQYISRIVGMPGEAVQLKSGVVQIDGEPLVQVADGEFVETFEPQGPMQIVPSCAANWPQLGGDCRKEMLTETASNGKRYRILNMDSGVLDDTIVFRVPDGRYFVLGDNRDNTVDSRIPQSVGGPGFIPRENIVGRADRVWFSSAGSRLWYFWTWRSKRFFTKIE